MAASLHLCSGGIQKIYLIEEKLFSDRRQFLFLSRKSEKGKELQTEQMFGNYRCSLYNTFFLCYNFCGFILAVVLDKIGFCADCREE